MFDSIIKISCLKIKSLHNYIFLKLFYLSNYIYFENIHKRYGCLKMFNLWRIHDLLMVRQFKIIWYSNNSNVLSYINQGYYYTSVFNQLVWLHFWFIVSLALFVWLEIGIGIMVSILNAFHGNFQLFARRRGSGKLGN